MSIFTLQLDRESFRIDSTQGIDLSIPLNFEGARLTAFGAPPAQAESFHCGRFLGDTKRGGSCNVEQYTVIPHCQGTHTECIGHIVDQAVYINDVFNDVWIPATILSLHPESPGDDQYIPEPKPNDRVITQRQLESGLLRFNDSRFHQALIIRTLANDTRKKSAHYSEAPYFSNNAMQHLAEYQVRHLLIDLPSVDRMDDQGKLSNHRIFWELSEVNQEMNPSAQSKTITELIYVPNEIEDGYYFLNLQVAGFRADAAPSRPIVFAVERDDFRK